LARLKRCNAAKKPAKKQPDFPQKCQDFEKSNGENRTRSSKIQITKKENQIMSYVDPDALHGSMSDLNQAIDDNAATLTANGTNPATVQASVTAIQTELGTAKAVRDKAKTALTNGQNAFANVGSGNYDKFSSIIDSVAGALGKKTPEGKRVLAIRKRLHSRSAKTAPPAPAAAPATK